MSTEDTGMQWDLPLRMGDHEMIAIEGLRRYGFDADADRISYKFLRTMAENFRRDGTIREKYNVVTRSSESGVELGYQMNVMGFGWTNAAFLELLHGFPKDMVERLGKEQAARQPSPRNKDSRECRTGQGLASLLSWNFWAICNSPLGFLFLPMSR